MSENGERPHAPSSKVRVVVFSPFVADAVMRIEAGALTEGSIDDLAGGLGVTARHLRRAMQAELGVSPIELAQSSRLALARRLLEETPLPITEIAFASGFRSLRRFNALFASAHGDAPSELRKRAEQNASGEGIALRIEYHGALDWEAMREAIGARQIPRKNKLCFVDERTLFTGREAR